MADSAPKVYLLIYTAKQNSVEIDAVVSAVALSPLKNVCDAPEPTVTNHDDIHKTTSK